MPIPSSGKLSLNAFATEFGVSGTAKLSDFRRGQKCTNSKINRDAGVAGSTGVQKMSTYRGAANPVVTWNLNNQNDSDTPYVNSWYNASNSYWNTDNENAIKVTNIPVNTATVGENSYFLITTFVSSPSGRRSKMNQEYSFEGIIGEPNGCGMYFYINPKDANGNNTVYNPITSGASTFDRINTTSSSLSWANGYIQSMLTDMEHEYDRTYLGSGQSSGLYHDAAIQYHLFKIGDCASVDLLAAVASKAQENHFNGHESNGEQRVQITQIDNIDMSDALATDPNNSNAFTNMSFLKVSSKRGNYYHFRKQENVPSYTRTRQGQTSGSTENNQYTGTRESSMTTIANKASMMIYCSKHRIGNTANTDCAIADSNLRLNTLNGYEDRERHGDQEYNFGLFFTETATNVDYYTNSTHTNPDNKFLFLGANAAI